MAFGPDALVGVVLEDAVGAVVVVVVVSSGSSAGESAGSSASDLSSAGESAGSASEGASLSPPRVVAMDFFGALDSSSSSSVLPQATIERARMKAAVIASNFFIFLSSVKEFYKHIDQLRITVFIKVSNSSLASSE